ncbi:unnamed protein product [Brassica oleracea var. botrytis]|uniref:DNA replication ATP-dependent helicase/nuclease n=1 Tax=Brassica napus TaxID=3708 RepID=A0A816RBS4_BRANA|nr:unnamed protein product [Brassica napus]
MARAVKALLIGGSSILLASYTNSAVDNLLIKLKTQGIEFLLIGRDDEAVHEEVRESCFSAMDMCSVDDIKKKVGPGQSCGLYLSRNQQSLPCIDRTFAVCLYICTCVGDHYQLPPLVQVDFSRDDMIRDQNAINNPVEASIIAEIVEELVNNGVDSKYIGIITPYNSQASLIQQAIPTASVEIHTIDKYQVLALRLLPFFSQACILQQPTPF